jgi:hypothetical protein
MSDYDEEEERAKRLVELKRQLSADLESRTSTVADRWRAEDDIYVAGYLSEILEWAHDWRSKIEELG